MKVVEVLERDANHLPRRVSIRDSRAPVAVIAQRIDGMQWEPLYGLRLRTEVRMQLPGCFCLSAECLRALDEAR